MAVLLVGGIFGFLHTRLPSLSGSQQLEPLAPPGWPDPLTVKSVNWSGFRGLGGAEQLGQPDFAKNFRFAGTFFLSNAAGTDVRKAVIGVVSDGRQVIASEGDVIGDVTVRSIFPDHVILKQGATEAELWLSFGSREKSGESGEASGEGEKSEKTRFGERVGDDRWALNRDSLMAYYNELLDSPERLLQVFDSLKPLYGDDGKITGYQVGIEGEREFFDAVGFREGDIVQKVNTLKMTNRNRAEFFIRQFAENKLSAVVIDVEREGKPKRLVYQVQ